MRKYNEMTTGELIAENDRVIKQTEMLIKALYVVIILNIIALIILVIVKVYNITI